jgi:hypothetical protein
MEPGQHGAGNPRGQAFFSRRRGGPNATAENFAAIDIMPIVLYDRIVIYIWFSKGRDVIPWKAVRAEKHSKPGWMLSSTG